MKKQRISSGTEWEDEVGYLRAVRVDGEIHVSGTTATDEDGTVVARGNPYRQTKQTIANIDEALEEAGATLNDVIRTRMYVVDIEDWAEIGRAHHEAFSTARPAATMVEVERLVDPKMLVKIEAVARVDS